MKLLSLLEKSTSEAQQKFFRLVYAVKTKQTPKSKVSKNVIEVADKMSLEDIKDFLKLKEDKIKEVGYNFKITYDLHSTNHSIERKSRHFNSTKTLISDDELSELIESAIPKLTQYLIYNKLDINDEFLLTDGSLNIIGTLLPEKNNVLKFLIITTMRKVGFKPKPNTKVINV